MKLKFPDDWTKGQIQEFYDSNRKPVKKAKGGYIPGSRVRIRHPNPKRFQEGGRVKFEDLDDVEEETVQFEDVGNELTGMDLVEAGATTAAGTGAALGLEEIGTRISEMKGGFERPSKVEQMIGSSMEKSGVDPQGDGNKCKARTESGSS